MSFETIKIRRQYNIVNDFVQYPNNLEKNRSKTTVESVLSQITCAEIITLGGGAGGTRTAGPRGNQQILILPETAVDELTTLCDGTTLVDDVFNDD